MRAWKKRRRWEKNEVKFNFGSGRDVGRAKLTQKVPSFSYHVTTDCLKLHLPVKAETCYYILIHSQHVRSQFQIRKAQPICKSRK